MLQPFVANRTIPGYVALVGDRSHIISLDVGGYANVESRTPMKTDTVFWIASQSKAMTAAALMMLVDEGKVNIDDPIEKYLPEFKNEWVIAHQDGARMTLRRPKHEITIRNLMTHTAGLPYVPADEDPPYDVEPLRDLVRSYGLIPLNSEPGTKFFYSNAGFNTIGRLIEVVSGVPYAQFMKTRLFDPLGMKDTTFWPNKSQIARLATTYYPNSADTALKDGPLPLLHYPLDDPTREPMPSGGIFSTAEDVGRFCQMLLNGGVVDGKRILSANAVHLMTTAETAPATHTTYGFGWDIKGVSAEHGGVLHTLMTINPKRGLFSVFMVQVGTPWAGKQKDLMYSQWRAVTEAPSPL